MRWGIHLFQLVVLIGALIPAAGCYRYTAIPVARLSPGMDVQARISSRGAERLGRRADGETSMGQELTIRGIVDRAGPDSLLFSLPTTLYEGDYRAKTTTQSIMVSRADVVSVDVRDLDKWKTGLMAAGIGIGAFIIVSRSRRGAGTSGSIPVHGGPPELRVPVGFQWLLPW